MFGGSDPHEGGEQGDFHWNGDTAILEDSDLMELFANVPDTEMSLQDAMQFNDDSLSDALARSQSLYLPEESQHSLGDLLDFQPGQAEGFAQLRGVAAFGQQEEQAAQPSGQADFGGLFPKVDAGGEPRPLPTFNDWEFVNTDSRGAPGLWRPPDPDDLGQIQPRSEDDSDSMGGEDQKAPPAFLATAQSPLTAPSPTELTRQGVSQLHIRQPASNPRPITAPLSAPPSGRGTPLINPSGMYSSTQGGVGLPGQNLGGLMLTGNGSLEGGGFGPVARGTLGVRKVQAKNEKNALKSRRHRARKKEREQSLERRVSELENDNKGLKEQLEKAHADKDALQRRLEEDGRRTMREVQNENAALRRDLELVRRAMEDLLNDRVNGRVDKERGAEQSGGG